MTHSIQCTGMATVCTAAGAEVLRMVVEVCRLSRCDLGEVRKRLGLMAKVESRKARAENWREQGCVDAQKRH